MTQKNDSSKKYLDEMNAAKITQNQLNAIKLSKSKNNIICHTNQSSSKCCISIWAIWYSLLVLAIHVYLTKNHIETIVKLEKNYASNTSATILIVNIHETFNIKDQLFYEMTSRICLISLSVLFLVLFFFTSLKQIGNYANDGVKFGRDFFQEKLHHQYSKENFLKAKVKKIQNQTTKSITPVPTVQLAVIESSSLTDDTLSNISSINDSDEKAQKRTACPCLSRIFVSIMSTFKLTFRHFLPFNSFFHLLSILLLIFPDLVYQNSTHEYLTCSNGPQAASCHFDLKPRNISNIREIVYDTSSFYNEINEFKFELTSIILAIISMYIRYGSVFWFTNKTLSFIVTFIGFIGGCEQLMQLYAFRYISKQIEFRHLTRSVFNLLAASSSISAHKNDTNSLLSALKLITRYNSNQAVYFPSQTSFNVPDEEPIFAGQLLNSKFTLFSLYLLLSCFVYFSAVPCYAFAYLKYKERFLIEEALFVRSALKNDNTKVDQETKLDVEKRKLNHYVSTVDMDINNLMANLEENTVIARPDEAHSCCFNYCPHLIATIQLIVMCGSKLPFCYDFIFYFNYYKDFGIMIAIIVEIIHTIILLFIWLTLTLKNDWNMHLQTSYSVCHWTYHMKLKESGLLKSSKIKKIQGTIEQIKTYDPLKTNQEQRNFDSSKSNKNASTINYSNLHSQMPKYLDQKYNDESRLRSNSNHNPNGTSRSLVEKKHQSLFVDNVNSNINPYQIDQTNNADYSCDPETVYRNEIRKSIRNVLQKNKQIRPTTISGSSLGLDNSGVPSSSTNIPIFFAKAPLQKQSVSQTDVLNTPQIPMPPPSSNYYYQNHHHHKYIYQNPPETNSSSKEIKSNGVYLSSSGPQIIDTINNVSSRTPTSNPPQPLNRQSINFNHPSKADDTSNKHARSVLYLDRDSSSSIEYESRV